MKQALRKKVIPLQKKEPAIFRKRKTETKGLVKGMDKLQVRAFPENDGTVSVEITCRDEKKRVVLTETEYGRRAKSEFKDGTVVNLSLFSATPINVGVTCWQKYLIYQFKLAA